MSLHLTQDLERNNDTADAISLLTPGIGGDELPGGNRISFNLNLLQQINKNKDKQTNTHPIGAATEPLTSEPIDTTSTGTTLTSTNTITNVHSLLTTVNSYLAVCNYCNGKQELQISAACTFATSLIVRCAACEKATHKLQQNIRRLEDKRHGYANNRANKRQLETIRGQIRRRKVKLTEIQDEVRQKVVKPLKINATLTCLSNGSTNSMMGDYEVNLRAILGAFMVGTGSSDIAKVVTTMGIGGGASFQRQFHRMGRFVHDRILRRCRTIISDSLRNEIKLTYDEILGEKMDEDELKELGKELNNGNLPTINSRIPVCPLAVSYDMGWNKRVGGRV